MKKTLFAFLALAAAFAATSCQSDEELLPEPPSQEPTNESVATTGTAMRKSYVGNIEVKWVQLWAGGPKFAEYNETRKISFAEATEPGSFYIWGSNWRTPSKEELSELSKAASKSGSSKIDCSFEEQDGVWGFRFTGKEKGYTDNSMFFPCELTGYWTATVCDDNKVWVLNLKKSHKSPTMLINRWEKCEQDCKDENYYVRPVLRDVPDTSVGTANAEINGRTKEVKWVQLWADSPKFAEMNLGANSVSEMGTKYNYNVCGKNDIDYLMTWGRYVWGVPTQEQLEELSKAIKGDPTAKVTYKYGESSKGSGVWGCTFSGKEGYMFNSVFFPAKSNDYDSFCLSYWTSSNSCWNTFNEWSYMVSIEDHESSALIRPVLKN